MNLSQIELKKVPAAALPEQMHKLAVPYYLAPSKGSYKSQARARLDPGIVSTVVDPQGLDLAPGPSQWLKSRESQKRKQWKEKRSCQVPHQELKRTNDSGQRYFVLCIQAARFELTEKVRGAEKGSLLLRRLLCNRAVTAINYFLPELRKSHPSLCGPPASKLLSLLATRPLFYFFFLSPSYPPLSPNNSFSILWFKRPELKKK